MSIQFSFGSRLLRAAVSLGFLGCLVAAGTISGQAATSESTSAPREAAPVACVDSASFYGGRCTNPNNGSDLMLTVRAEINLSDEYGVAFEDEDSIEIFRVDIQQRTFGIDRVVIRPKVASRAARNARPNISPPLLV